MTVSPPTSSEVTAPDQDQPLTGGVRAGYALGSLATGAFGTVPGLLLLPYLTDTLGVAAGRGRPAGAAAEGVGRADQPGRRADLRPHRHPLGRPAAVPARSAGSRWRCCSPRSSPAPFGTGARRGAYVAVAFLAAATAFAFFQVPYVAMPAEMTDGYAERTRLMTWRVAVLAVAILVSGAVAPLVVERRRRRHRRPPAGWACSSAR